MNKEKIASFIFMLIGAGLIGTGVDLLGASVSDYSFWLIAIGAIFLIFC